MRIYRKGFRRSIECVLRSAIDRLRLEGIAISRLEKGYGVAGNIDLALIMEDRRLFMLIEIASSAGTKSRSFSNKSRMARIARSSVLRLWGRGFSPLPRNHRSQEGSYLQIPRHRRDRGSIDMDAIDRGDHGGARGPGSLVRQIEETVDQLVERRIGDPGGMI